MKNAFFGKLMAALLCGASMALAAVGSADKTMAVGGWAQGGNSGEHAGLDFKIRQGEINAFDIYASFKFSKHDNSLGAYLGYYWNFYDLIPLPTEAGRMGLYFGPAGGLGWWDVNDETGVALRAGLVGGWEWEFPKPIPLELYLEVNPVGEFHYLWYDRDDDATDWELPDLFVRIGLRFWF